MNKISNFLLIAALVYIAIPIYAAKDEFSKTLQKEYNVHENTSLEIVNKYGEIHIEDWDRQLIRIDVKITVEHNNKAEADELLKMINVSFGEIGDAVKAISTPVLEVHISNTFSREPFRHQSFISPNAKGIIIGFGLKSYELALQSFL